MAYDQTDEKSPAFSYAKNQKEDDFYDQTRSGERGRLSVENEAQKEQRRKAENLSSPRKEDSAKVKRCPKTSGSSCSFAPAGTE